MLKGPRIRGMSVEKQIEDRGGPQLRGRADQRLEQSAGHSGWDSGSSNNITRADYGSRTLVTLNHPGARTDKGTGMIFDARSVDKGTEIEADLCIIGAGAAGITLAKAFDARNIRVCLIESGGLAYDEQINSLYHAQNIGHPYWPLDECQFRAFGGNTNCWGGWSRPFEEINFRTRSWVPHSGWPFPRSELEPYYGPAHKIVQIRSGSYDLEEAVAELADKQAQLLPLDPARLENHIYRFSPPTRFRFTYLDEISKSNNIRCFLHGTATNIETDHNGQEIRRIAVSCLDGNSFTVRATVFVLAMGGTENPRLLLNSRDQMSCGLGNAHDLVGRFFMEHPHTNRRIIPMSKRGSSFPLSLYSVRYYARGLSARLSLPVATQEREGLLGYGTNITPVYGDGEGWFAIRKIVLALSSSRQHDPFLRFPPYGSKRITPHDILQISRSLPQSIVSVLRFLSGTIKRYVLESSSEQAPNPDSRVMLQSEKDPFGLQRVSLNWRTLPIDRHTVIRSEEIVESELRRFKIGTLEPLKPEELVEWPASGLRGGWHQLGTTRMSDDPRRGVVDRNGRVHGIGNLFIAGGSTFPTVGAGPPTLTVIAMALRLSDHLMQRFARRARTRERASAASE
jgi:choline dehydrogenase-like flavoprotein